MFQSFDVTTNPANAHGRIKNIRLKMQQLGLDGFLVPRADEHQGEYVPPHANRLAYLTGFTGSAGMALILKDKAIIFVDGRYSLQVRQQTDPQIFDYEDLIYYPPSKWLTDHGKGLTIGFDPWLHTIAGVKALTSAMHDDKKGQLVVTKDNLVDLIWSDQPAPPLSQVSIQPLEFAGLDTKTKLETLQQNIQSIGATATILTDPSSIAWAFNIRGHDVSNTPFTLAFAIISTTKRALLFIDERKLNVDVKHYLQQYCDIAEPTSLMGTVEKLVKTGTIFALDPNLTADQLRMVITQNQGKIVEAPDPACLPRATKNPTELAGARRAHLRDGVALCRFFAWLEQQTIGSTTEISAAKQLEAFREETAHALNSKLEDLSFDSISGSGPHGAIIHYRVNENTDRSLNDGELYLIDSGGQYRDGTTDVTRTLAIGTVGDAEKHCFTLVLKGMIAMSTARFPTGTRGQDLDVLARIALWNNGYDYAHGTGHGVGSYLSVHEGPQNLSRRGTQPLLAGMIVSNEPGYYREGAFGIRIENLLVVEPAADIKNGEIAMHSFETLTLCPIDQRLIANELLTITERDWLNSYHQRVYQTIAPHLDENDKAWLKTATAPLNN